MRYIFMIIGLMFFIGCSPKYRVVTQHVMPTNEGAKFCVRECQKSYDSCKQICKANFDICKGKAEVIAKENYNKKMQTYHIRLEQYADDMQMYDLEMDLMYYDGFYGYGNFYGYGSRGFYPGFYGFYQPSFLYMNSFHSFRPMKPRKPSLQAEREFAQRATCRIDCGCTKPYDDCFTGCGGSIKVDKVCIENCPSDR